ncbi:MAG: hypothetical protein WAM46_09850 [Flavobacterium sp.]|jgi:hypothetical protein
MAIQTLETIKNWFKKGLKPTQAQFWDTWDSFRHKEEKVDLKDVEGIDELLANLERGTQTLDEVLEKGNTSYKSANIGGVWINPTPGNNVVLGSANTGQGLPNSNYNTIVGIGAGAYASENYYSNMFGTYAGQSSSGNSNTFLGSFSGLFNAGSGTVGIGINAGRSNTNNNVVMLSGLKYGDGGTLLPSNDHQFVIGSVADKPIRFNTNVETPLDFNFPSRSGTLATTDDIQQSSTLEQVVTQNPIISNGQNIINELGAGRTVVGPGVIAIYESGTHEKSSHYGSRHIQFLDGTGNHATIWGEGGNGTYFMPNKASGNYTLATTQDIKIGTNTPSSSTDTGEPGEIRLAAGYIYWCTAPNTWFRSQATSF